MLQADSEKLRQAWVHAVQASIASAYRESPDSCYSEVGPASALHACARGPAGCVRACVACAGTCGGEDGVPTGEPRLELPRG